MAFDNKLIVPLRSNKPHIIFHDGYWRVSAIPKGADYFTKKLYQIAHIRIHRWQVVPELWRPIGRPARKYVPTRHDPVALLNWSAPKVDDDEYINDMVHPFIGCSLALVNRTDEKAKALVEKYGSIYLGNFPKTDNTLVPK